LLNRAIGIASASGVGQHVEASVCWHAEHGMPQPSQHSSSLCKCPPLLLLVLVAQLDIIGEVYGGDCLIVAPNGPLLLSLWFLCKMILLHMRSNWQLQWWCFYASI
jgi:hypothetical protein